MKPLAGWEAAWVWSLVAASASLWQGSDRRVLPGAQCRAMEFVVALLQRLHDDREVTLPEAASETYTATLYRYHGWITSSAFTVALKVPQIWGA